MEIAVYGKGGIGKSTMSANLSAALALSGKHVLQIGCDPKHDSTRLLMHGKEVPTVLEYLKDHDKNLGDLNAVLKPGTLGIGCVEAGGPRPGVGCAGRGIISAFEFLELKKAKDPYDIVVYDVLGDVVCGGFAVPVRREYADAIFLVTSGEYMAIYAANNILRGIRNYDQDTYRRVAGIIYNARNLEDEDGRVHRFARAVGLPIVAKVPRSDAFARAELQKKPVMELDGCDAEKGIFLKIAGGISEEMTLYPALPLSDEELEQLVLHTAISDENTAAASISMETMNAETGVAETCTSKTGAAETGTAKTGTAKTGADVGNVSEPVLQPKNKMAAKRLPLYGCAFNGAATLSVHLMDALVIAHAPRACAFYTWQNISSPGRKNLFNRGILMPSAISPNFSCTDMGQTEAVFGGTAKLREAVLAAREQHPGAIVVISSCVSGIIGDDLASLEDLSTKECPIIVIHADGVITGDYMEGIRLSMRTIGTKLIDRSVKPQGRLVNLINETSVSNNSEINFRIVKDLLGKMDISINARFLGDTTCRDMKNFLAAPLNILTADSPDGLEVKQWLVDTYGCTFAENALPVGFAETKRWLFEIAAFFHCEELLPEILADEEKKYQRRIDELKPHLAGKKLMITTINSSMDWLLETVDDLQMEVTWIGVLNYLRMPLHISNHEKFQSLASEDVSVPVIQEKIAQTKPDIVLSNYTSLAGEGDFVSDTLFMTQVVGFQSGIHVIERWVDLLSRRSAAAQKGGWQEDERLFTKYFG